VPIISIESKGSFKRTEKFLERMQKQEIFAALEKYGEMGVQALASATPSATGETANSWYYTVSKKSGSYSLIWHNRHVDEDGVSVAVLIQYGHATGTGGYVQGRDFINPAIRPIFDQIAAEVWKAVTK
jgi:hypothetical protein